LLALTSEDFAVSIKIEVCIQQDGFGIDFGV